HHTHGAGGWGKTPPPTCVRVRKRCVPRLEGQTMIPIRWCAFVLITGVACASRDAPTPTQESAPTPVNGGSRTEELARRLEEKLASAQRDLAEQEQRVERAKKEAKFYECKARNERLRSEVARHEAQCMNELATQAQCAAEV